MNNRIWNNDLRLLFLAGLFVAVLYAVAPLLYRSCDTSLQAIVYTALHNKYVYSGWLILAAAAVLLYWHSNYWIHPFYDLREKLLPLFVIIIFGLGGVFFVYTVIGKVTPQEAITRIGDRDRMRDVNAIQNTLEIYRQEHEGYPDDLQKLASETILFESLRDPITGRFYEYAVSGDKKQYVLKAVLGVTQATCYDRITLAPLAKQSYPSYLEEEMDGYPMGLNCEDPAYCVGSP